MVSTTDTGVKVQAYSDSEGNTELTGKRQLTNGTTTIYVKASKGLVSESYTISVTLTPAQTGANLGALTVKGNPVPLTSPTGGTGSSADPYTYVIDTVTAEQNNTAELMAWTLASDSDKATVTVTDKRSSNVDEDAQAATTPISNGDNWTIKVASQELGSSKKETYYKVTVTTAENYKGVVGQVGGNASMTITAYGDDVVDGYTFDETKGFTFTVTPEAGYRIDKVYYMVGAKGSATGQNELSAENGVYTISSANLTGIGTDSKVLNISVVMTANPKVTFSGVNAGKVLIDNKTVSSPVTVTPGSDLTFTVPSSVTPTGSGLEKGATVDGYTSWTIKNVTVDVTITVGA